MVRSNRPRPAPQGCKALVIGAVSILLAAIAVAIAIIVH